MAAAAQAAGLPPIPRAKMEHPEWGFYYFGTFDINRPLSNLPPRDDFSADVLQAYHNMGQQWAAVPAQAAPPGGVQQQGIPLPPGQAADLGGVPPDPQAWNSQARVNVLRNLLGGGIIPGVEHAGMPADMVEGLLQGRPSIDPLHDGVGQVVNGKLHSS